MRLLKTQVETLRAIDMAICPNVLVLAKRLGIPISSAANRVRTLIKQGRLVREGRGTVHLTPLGRNELEKENA